MLVLECGKYQFPMDNHIVFLSGYARLGKEIGLSPIHFARLFAGQRVYKISVDCVCSIAFYLESTTI